MLFDMFNVLKDFLEVIIYMCSEKYVFVGKRLVINEDDSFVV